MITNLFETPIFVSNIDAKKIKFKHEKISVTKDWISKTVSSHNNKNVLTEESAKYLMDCIIKSLDRKYRNYEVALMNIWTNKYIKDDYQEPHIHPFSTFSFIIYKKVTKSQTYFLSPYRDLIASFDVANVFESMHELQCQNNQMVIFPSFVKHGVHKNSGNETMAGNLKFRFRNESNR
tara:strand:- start:58 stop:591 length:534 start_codon:yes stop_codon:yes gene_type:complete